MEVRLAALAGVVGLVGAVIWEYKMDVVNIASLVAAVGLALA